MANRKTRPAPKTAIRKDALRDMLLGRQRALQNEVHQHLRNGRVDAVTDVREDMEHSDANHVASVAFALLEMKGETMRLIDEALRRVEAGTYGWCALCGVEISETRLRALPFAVRCVTCEAAREQAQARRLADADGGTGRFASLAPPKGPAPGVTWG